jgi:hypothetical protein
MIDPFWDGSILAPGGNRRGEPSLRDGISPIRPLYVTGGLAVHSGKLIRTHHRFHIRKEAKFEPS